MTESEALSCISAHVAKNKIRAALEDEAHQKMVVEAIIMQIVETLESDKDGQTTASKRRRLDPIYDDKPFGFEKDTIASTKRTQAHNTLEEIDLGDGTTNRLAYISAKIDSSLRNQTIKVLKEFKDCVS